MKERLHQLQENENSAGRNDMGSRDVKSLKGRGDCKCAGNILCFKEKGMACIKKTYPPRSREDSNV